MCPDNSEADCHAEVGRGAGQEKEGCPHSCNVLLEKFCSRYRLMLTIVTETECRIRCNIDC